MLLDARSVVSFSVDDGEAEIVHIVEIWICVDIFEGKKCPRHGSIT